VDRVLRGHASPQIPTGPLDTLRPGLRWRAQHARQACRMRRQRAHRHRNFP